MCKDKKKVIDTLSTELPIFKEEMPMHFSNSSCYKRQDKDQNSYTLLEDVFKKMPKNQIIQIEVKD